MAITRIPWATNDMQMSTLHVNSAWTKLAVTRSGNILGDIDGLVQDCSNSSALAMEYYSLLPNHRYVRSFRHNF